MTFAQILSDLYRRTNYASSPASEVTTRLKAFVNEALQDLLSEPGMASWLARVTPPITVASVANQAEYAIPLGLERITALVDRTNDRELLPRDVDWYRAVQPDPASTTGTPECFVPFGFGAVAVQPAAATGLWVASTSGSDTTQTVYVESVRTGGIVSERSLILNGTTRVQLGSATTHESVTKFYVSATTVGDVVLYDAAAAGNELGRIYIGQTSARYFTFALWPTPAAVLTYHVEGDRPLLDLVNNTDEPPIPARFHRLLIDGALMREWDKKDDSRAREAERRYEKGLSQLRYFLTCPPDYLPVAGSLRAETSRLGAWFPDGAGVR